MAIKIKSRDPKTTDFKSDDIVINIKEGTLFYKTNKELFKIQGDKVSTPLVESNLTALKQVGDVLTEISASSFTTDGFVSALHITSSGNISSSGTLTTKDLITDFANIEKLYLPGQGVGTMTVGSTFAVGETVQVVGNVDVKGGISVSGSIIPEGSGSFDLGSAQHPWKDLHIFSQSIHFYDNDGEIGKVSYIKNEGLRISDETDSIEGIVSTINGGSF